jgi:hypothetical protein
VTPREETRNSYRILMGNPLEKPSLGRPRKRLVYSGEMGLKDGKWMDLVQDRVQ